MKNTPIIPALLLLFILSACEKTPQPHLIVDKTYSFEQIINTADIRSGSGSIQKEALLAAEKVSGIPAKTHLLEATYASAQDEDAVFGRATFETVFHQYRIGQTEWWLPTSWTAQGYADSTSSKMLAQPDVEFNLRKDSSFIIEIRSKLHVGDLNLKVSYQKLTNEQGRTYLEESTSGLGASSF
ncbi:MAG: hypothetical protein AAF206_08525, partial [Bacteroidota bacterium]